MYLLLIVYKSFSWTWQSIKVPLLTISWHRSSPLCWFYTVASSSVRLYTHLAQWQNYRAQKIRCLSNVLTFPALIWFYVSSKYDITRTLFRYRQSTSKKIRYRNIFIEAMIGLLEFCICKFYEFFSSSIYLGFIL